MTERRATYRTRTSPGRVDANQGQIIDAIRAAGWFVIDTSASKRGFPDLVAVKPDGRVLLIEVKARESVTDDEIDLMVYLVNDAYRVISSPEQLMAALGREIDCF